jgi:hypothetical protein
VARTRTITTADRSRKLSAVCVRIPMLPVTDATLILSRVDDYIQGQSGSRTVTVRNHNYPLALAVEAIPGRAAAIPLPLFCQATSISGERHVEVKTRRSHR